MKRTTILSLFLTVLFSSCNTTNYIVVNDIKNDYNFKIEDGYTSLSSKHFNPTKIIFARINDSLSDDFYLHFFLGK